MIDEKTVRNIVEKVISDKLGEKYYVKGESDPKKIFIVVWLIIILMLSSASLWLYSFNNGLV